MGALCQNSLLCRKSAILSSLAPFWGLPSGPKKLKKLTGALRCMHKAPKCIQSLWDHPKKIRFCAKVQKSAIVRSLGKKPHFGAFPEAQKGVLICAICLRKAAHWPNNCKSLGAIRKNSLLCRKSALSIRWKKPPFWGFFPRPQKAQKANGALRCMHKAPKCIQSLWDHPKKIPCAAKKIKRMNLCKSTKKARYVRSLGKKPHFGAFPEAQKGVLICAICLRKAAHWPNNNANSGLSEKTVYCVESCDFVDKVEKCFFPILGPSQKLYTITFFSDSPERFALLLGSAQPCADHCVDKTPF